MSNLKTKIMKTTVLISIFLIAFSSYSQTTLYALDGTVNDTGLPADGYNSRSYTMFAPETVFDQSSAGFDKIWDISAFTELTDFKYYFNTDATPDEIIEYPGAAMVTTGSISTSEGTTVVSKAYATGSLHDLVSYSDTGLTLNYSTNNLEFGSFPLSYGDLHLDNVISGTYVLGEYSGTFVGTFIAEVDAYGDMITGNEGTFEVTRLKTIETLQINYSSFENIGTLVKTTYRYYRAGDLWPFVKSTNTVTNIEMFDLDTNTTNIEKAPAVFLSLPDLELNNGITVFPNPSKNEINISIEPNQKIVSSTVIDSTGKIILTENETAHLDISSLPNGIYLLKIQTNGGSSVKRIIKH